MSRNKLLSIDRVFQLRCRGFWFIWASYGWGHPVQLAWVGSETTVKYLTCQLPLKGSRWKEPKYGEDLNCTCALAHGSPLVPLSEAGACSAQRSKRTATGLKMRQQARHHVYQQVMWPLKILKSCYCSTINVQLCAATSAHIWRFAPCRPGESSHVNRSKLMCWSRFSHQLE